MPSTLVKYRVFIASPTGLESFRHEFRETLDEYNQLEAVPRGVLYEPVGWEYTMHGRGRPQALINEDLKTCDHAVFLFRDRWGSPPAAYSPYSSGCEEEWHLSERLARQGHMRSLHLFFLPIPEAQLKDPGEQLRRVLEFRRRIETERQYMCKPLLADREFAAELRAALGNWLRTAEGIDRIKTHAIASNLRSQEILRQGPALNAELLPTQTVSTAQRLLQRALIIGPQRGWPVALALIEEALVENPTPEIRAKALVSLGLARRESGQVEAAIEAYDAVLEEFTAPQTLTLREEVAGALFDKGLCLNDLELLEDEVAVYDELVVRFGADPEPSLRKRVAWALTSMGYTLITLGRMERALAAFNEVIARFGSINEPTLCKLAARAWINKGYCLSQLGRTEEEISLYDQFIARFPPTVKSDVREQVTEALLRKGCRLDALGRPSEAVGAFDELLRHYGDDTDLSQQDRIAIALLNKGAALVTLERSDEALEAYDSVLSRFSATSEPLLRRYVAEALLFKAFRLGDLERSEEEMAIYDVLLSDFPADTGAIREVIAQALLHKGWRLATLGKAAEAIELYDELLARFGAATELGLRKHVMHALLNKAIAWDELPEQGLEELAAYDELLARFGGSTEQELIGQVVVALYNKGLILEGLGREKEAQAVRKEFCARFGEAVAKELDTIVQEAKDAVVTS